MDLRVAVLRGGRSSEHEASGSGISYAELMDRLVNLAVERYEAQRRFRG